MRILAVVLGLAVAASAQGAGAALRAGIAHYKQGAYEKALTEFARMRQLAPQDWQGHTWQAMTLLQMAIFEKDPARRAALTREAEAMTAALVKQCDLPFQHPLRLYILGLGASIRNEPTNAVNYLTRAHRADDRLFKGYAFEQINLKGMVARAYARALLEFSKRFIQQGKFERADRMLRDADRAMPREKDNVDSVRELERSFAVVDEGLGRFDSAVARLRKCIGMFSDRPELQQEFIGTIAQIYFKAERFDEGVKALAEAKKDSKNPEILAARCTALMIPALRAPRKSEKVTEALAYYRTAMAAYPASDVHRLVEDYCKIVLHKVGPRQAKESKELLEDAVQRMLAQIRLRPECPSFYYLCYKLYKLLGDEKNEVKFQTLAAQKKKEFEGKALFDHRGRPRCK